MGVSRFSRLDPAAYALPADLVERLLSPALIVYLDRARDNIARVIEYCGADPGRWRPHVKSSKLPELFVELIRAGVRNFKCATTREARCLLETLAAESVVDADLLLAYPLTGPAIHALRDLALRFPATRVSLLCEAPAATEEIPSELSIFIDINPGMNRTGVPVADFDRVGEIAERAGRRFRGIHYYDGHVHGADREERRRMAWAGYDGALEHLARLRDAGLDVDELVTSGTQSFLHALSYPRFRDLEGTRHRISPGTVVLHDLRSEQELEELDLRPAALVASRVISHPAPGIATCDAGSKSIAADAGDPCAFVLGHPELEALSPSEEHLPLRAADGEPPPRGTLLLLVPTHVCPTVNLAEQAVLVDGDQVRSGVPVRARAHDLLIGPDRVV